MTETRTWTVEVWDRPTGEDRYMDAHSEHRPGTAWYRRLEAKGHDKPSCGSVQCVGRVFFRTYKSKAAAERMAERYRRVPGLYVDVNPGFSLSW